MCKLVNKLAVESGANFEDGTSSTGFESTITFTSSNFDAFVALIVKQCVATYSEHEDSQYTVHPIAVHPSWLIKEKFQIK